MSETHPELAALLEGLNRDPADDALWLVAADWSEDHEVEITRPFCLGMFPVTQGQFETLTSLNPCSLQSDQDDAGGGAAGAGAGVWGASRKRAAQGERDMEASSGGGQPPSSGRRTARASAGGLPRAPGLSRGNARHARPPRSPQPPPTPRICQSGDTGGGRITDR